MGYQYRPLIPGPWSILFRLLTPDPLVPAYG